MKLLMIVLLSLSLTGCAAAGPFVTKISPGRNGSLVVESCKIRAMTLLMTFVWKSGCRTSRTPEVTQVGANP